ncbi:MAG TPA: hypothetical protein VNA13_00185 [Xanthomonadales bacterium]|nr:hypothetical protein [Xanthomonadales bacterium]
MNIEHLLNTYSLYLLVFGTASLAILATIALKAKKLSEDSKTLLFIAIIGVTLIPTLVMSGSTVYLNTISSSGGPVHWHADIEIWKCGTEVDLKDPKGLSNKIGTSTLHEHNDKRIHLEGVVLKPEDASLGNFFHVIGGSLASGSFSVPTNEGLLSVKNGDTCLTSDVGEVQVFSYSTDSEGYYQQQKLLNPQDHIIAPTSIVPSGDCIIVEFDTPKDKTDKMCRSYKVALEIGKLKGEKNGN